MTERGTQSPSRELTKSSESTDIDYGNEKPSSATGKASDNPEDLQSSAAPPMFLQINSMGAESAQPRSQTAASEAPPRRFELMPSGSDEVGDRPSLDSDRLSILSDILSAYPPALSRLASNASSKASRGRDYQRQRALTPIYEQRHPGKEGARLSRHTRDWSPGVADEVEEAERNGKLRKAAAAAEDDGAYLQGLPLGLLVLGLCLVVFLISIDRTIITTVREPVCFLSFNTTDLWIRPFRSLQQSSARPQTSDGTAPHIC